MKKIIHKNQVVITTLAVLIAIAGYVSYDRKNGGPEETKTVANTTGIKTSGVENKDSGVTAILKSKHPELFND